ncbi:hypothetical protein ES703_53047 [subsurface metagenome]
MEAHKQTNVLQQKKLKTSSSSTNSLCGGGSSSVVESSLPIPDFNSESFQSQSKRITEKLLNSFRSPEISPEGVYIYTVNIQHFTKDVQSTLFDKKPTHAEMLHKNYPNIMFFDSAWKLLDPSIWYTKLLTECLSISKSECAGHFTGEHNKFTCEKGGTVYKPRIKAGAYNPYKKMLSARASVSRSFKVLRYIEKITKNKVYLMQTVLTLPKKFSEFLFDDPDGKEKYLNCINIFIKKFEIFLRPSKRKRKKLQLGVWDNLHDWGSNKPFNPHEHPHLLYPNFLYSSADKKFTRFQPFYSKHQRKKIKELWRESLVQGLNLNNTASIYGDFKDLIIQGELNVNHEYKKEKHEQLHLLKYARRSWLCDVGKYFMNCNKDNDHVRFSLYWNWIKKQFKKFVAHGCIENRTRVHGFLHNFKKVLEDHDLNYYDFRHDTERECDICGNKIINKQKVHGFKDVGELALFVAHKTKYKFVGVLQQTYATT